jgi:hypothetical protein
MQSRDYPQKITFGEMRSSGVRDVLVYSRDHRCSHYIAISANRCADHIRLSNIEPGFVCSACCKRGRGAAEVFASPHGGRLGQGRPNTFAGRPSMDYARTHNL